LYLKCTATIFDELYNYLNMYYKAILLATFLGMLSATVSAQVFSDWRGEKRDGLFPDKGLLREWPADGPEIVWHFDGLGIGFSSPAFGDDVIYMTGMEGETGYLYALSMSGDLLWKAPYGPEFTESFPGTRSTPVVVGNKVYMYTGHGVVVCMNASNGAILWKNETHKTLGGLNIRWGVTENLIIDGDKLYCSVGGEKNNVVALNRNTGDVIWSSPGTGRVSAYGSPLLIKVGERNLLVTMMESHIQGHDANTGKMLWSYDFPNRWFVHPNTPIYADNALLCTSGYGKGSVKLLLSSDGSSVTKIWESPLLESRMGGVVKIGKYVYGSGDTKRGIRCIDWFSGDEVWVDITLGNGVTIAADDLLFYYSDRGELALIDATPDGFNLLSKTKVLLGNDQHWAHPVIHTGRLYLRHGNALIVYKIK
jgi:outer membrane protein assembly factor BamB